MLAGCYLAHQCRVAPFAGYMAIDSRRYRLLRGRMARPEETASAALFVASDKRFFVNGSELFVDGGSAQI